MPRRRRHAAFLSYRVLGVAVLDPTRQSVVQMRHVVVSKPELTVCLLTHHATTTKDRLLREKPNDGKLAARGPSPGKQLAARGPRPENTIRSSLTPPSNTVRAALFERERLLTEKLRFMSEGSYRHRLKVELELGDTRRKLERLASQTERRGARSPDRTGPNSAKTLPPKGHRCRVFFGCRPNLRPR